METDYEGMLYAFSFIFYHFNDCDKFYFVQINQKMFSVSSHYCFYTFYLNLQMSFLWRVAAGSIRHWVRNSVIHEGFETPNSPQLKGSGLFSFGIWLGSLLGAYSVRYFRHIQLRGDPETDLGPYFYFFRICGNDDWKLVQNDLKNLQIFLKSTKKWKIKCVQSLICVVIFVQLCKSLPVKQNFNANFFAGFFLLFMCSWGNSGHWGSDRRHHRVNFLRPATRMQSFTRVWQHLVCSPIKSHSHPCKAKQTAEGANHIYHLEAIRPIAG